MLKTVSFVLCVSLCASVYIAKGSCPTNEEYQLCGSACPRTCQYPYPRECTNNCVEGCFCMTGYLRDANRTCVNADKCRASETKQGADKPLTQGQAVPTAVCGDNEEFLPCGTACPATCAVPEPEICTLSCSMGCFCKEGFYRDEVTHKCVTYDNCTKEENCFNPDEVYDICNATCQPSCSEPEPICTKECSSGCICARGLLRSPDGECVSVDKCPTTNGTSPDVLTKYLNTISKILHLTAA